MIYVLFTWLAVAPACRSLQSGKITAGDLARAVPEFSALAPETPLLPAPLPGAHRTLTPAEMRRIAAQQGVAANPPDSVCFEWPMQKLTGEQVRAALATALGGPAASFELEEFSLFPAPPGDIIFPRDAVSRRAAGATVWRGYVLYANGGRFPIWARLRLPDLFDVQNGDRVKVVVEDGAAQLKLDAQAVSAGVKGQVINVRNPRSGKLFAAEVTGRGSVRVIAERAEGETIQ